MGDYMKKKEIKIIEEELTPTVLAVKKDNKKVSAFGIVWIIIIFGIFITGVIYLPEISLYISNYLNKEVDTPIVDNSKKDNDLEEEKEEVIVYNIENNLEIIIDKLKINNISVVNNTLSLVITNTSEDIISLKDNNYFVNLYDDNKKIVERIMLDGDVLALNSLTLSYNLTDSASKLSILKIDPQDYPAYVVSDNENKVGEIVCQKEYEVINYLFSDNKLYAITMTYEVSESDPNFSTLYNTYQLLSVSYNSYEGVTSSINVGDGLLTFKTIINLSSAPSNLNLKTVYPNNTDAKIIHFELTASGYTCK